MASEQKRVTNVTFLLLILFLINIVIFVLYPSLDIKVSELFLIKGASTSSIFSQSLHMLAYLYGVALVLWIAFAAIPSNGNINNRGGSEVDGNIDADNNASHYRKLLYVALVVLLGYFMAPTAIKNTTARPRPIKVIDFGGDLEFVRAFAIGKQCKYDCSFVSHHASAGFLTYSLAFIASNKTRRRNIFIFGTFLGLFFGFTRIVMGRHFLSDVIFAGWFMYWVCWILYKLLKIDSLVNNK